MRLPARLPSWPWVLVATVWLVLPVFIAQGDYLADPTRALVHHAGEVATWLFVAVLAMTPLRQLTGWSGWIAWRRAFGLMAFAAVSIHLLVFAGLWQQFDPDRLLTELVKRPYLWPGMAAWLLLLPLVATSTRRARQRLGRRWNNLHRLVYLIVLLGVWHQAWAAKAGWLGVWLPGTVLFLLLCLRFRQFRLVLSKD